MGSEEGEGKGRLEVVASAGSEIEADLIRQRLAAAGISAIAQRTIGGPEWGTSGARYVYVDATELAQALEILNEGEDVGEAELRELSEREPEPDS